jgi:hypothetical protein
VPQSGAGLKTGLFRSRHTQRFQDAGSEDPLPKKVRPIACALCGPASSGVWFDLVCQIVGFISGAEQ